jgi:uncharacterized protein
MERIFISLYRALSKHKLIFFTGVILAGIAVAYYASKIRFEEDISKSIPGENEQIISIVNNSRLTNKLIIRISSANSAEIVAPESLIAFADNLVDSLSSKTFSPFIEQFSFKVGENMMEDVMVLFYDNTPLFLEEEDYQKIDSLIQPQNIDRALQNTINNLMSPAAFVMKDYLLRDPLGISSLALARLKQFQIAEGYDIRDGYIFANHQTSMLLFINPLNPPSETQKNTLLFKKLDVLIHGLQTADDENIKAEYYGASAVAVGNARQVKNDIALTVTIAMVVILIFIGWYFRSGRIPFISFLPAVFGGITAIALINLFKGSMSTIALGIGSVLLGIIVDYALYFYSLYKAKGSVEIVLRDITLSVVICAVTSATAFFSLLFVQSEVLKDLGLFAGLSILGAALFSLAILPHLVKMKRMQQTADKKNPVNKMASLHFESNKILLAAIVIVTVIFWFFSKKAGFETDMYAINYMSPELAEAEKNLSQISDIATKSVYLVSVGESLSEALSSNEKVLAKLKKLKDNHVIRNYTNVGGILVSDSLQTKRINNWKKYWTPDKISNLRKSIDDSGEKLGFKPGAFVNFFETLNKEYQPLRIDAFDPIRDLFLNDMVSAGNNLNMVVSLIKVDDEHRPDVYEAFSGDANCITIDRQAITANMVAGVKQDFDKLVKMCLIFVTLMLVIAFGRLETGLIAALPMFISWLWTLGFMGLTGIRFNIINIIVSTFVFGLGVDYSILMIRSLLLEYKFGHREMTSYKTSVFLSAFTTLVGIGVLILAKHPSLHSIALISVFGIVSVVLISVTTEPLLFKMLISKRRHRRIVPLTFFDLVATSAAFAIFLSGSLFLNLLLMLIWPLPISVKNKKLIMHHAMVFFCKLPVYAMVHIKKRIVNLSGEDFSRPAVILSNHQSHIDLLLLLMLHPKIIVLTTKWVWNNPVYALVIRFLDYYPVRDGHEDLVERLKTKVKDGYSVLVFPEGSRSPDGSIRRFHKGAFLLAEQLGIDMLPVFIHGAGDCMNKGENHLKGGSITVKIYPRIAAEDKLYGNDYHERTKALLAFYRKEYASIREELETPDYFRLKLIRNYIYKGPVLEWYVRVKLRLEGNYKVINDYIPRTASVVDIGCGYGYLSYMLGFVSPLRSITGIDYDTDKIALANHCISKNDKVHFVAADAVEYPYQPADVFILSDVLHYIPYESQEKLLETCISLLNPGGKIIIRDADRDLKKRHKRTKYTEFYSTRFGFNKSRNKELYFFPADSIYMIGRRNNMHVQSVDNSWLTSNVLFVLQK